MWGVCTNKREPCPRYIDLTTREAQAFLREVATLLKFYEEDREQAEGLIESLKLRAPNFYQSERLCNKCEHPLATNHDPKYKKDAPGANDFLDAVPLLENCGVLSKS